MSPIISHILIFAFLYLVAAIQPNKHQPHFKASHYTLSSYDDPLLKNLNALNQDIKTLSHPLNPLADVTETVPRTQINLLTYNLYLRPPTIQDDEHDDYKDQRLEEFIKLLPNYDIICFEEVFAIMSKRKNKLIESGKLAGFLYNMSAPAPSPGFITDGALLILSRFPIVASDFQAFPKGEGIEGFVEKGVLYAKIQVKDDILHLFHTHQFANSGGVNALVKRGEGFVAWRDFMKQCFKEYQYREGEVCLLVGDFNVNGNGAKMTASELTGHPVLNLYPNLSENGPSISEYEAMIAILGGNNSDSIEDILYKKNEEHPATMSGSIYEEGNGPAFDYIFKFTPQGILEDGEGQESEEEVEKGGQINVLEDSVKVEKFNVTDKPFKLLSDHYGVSVALEYAEK